MNVSVQDINLTVTSYLIASGIFPTVTGSVADVYGRRITLIVSLTAYAAINVGLATQRSFAALFVLRMLQSAAISGNVRSPSEHGFHLGHIVTTRSGIFYYVWSSW